MGSTKSHNEAGTRRSSSRHSSPNFETYSGKELMALHRREKLNEARSSSFDCVITFETGLVAEGSVSFVFALEGLEGYGKLPIPQIRVLQSVPSGGVLEIKAGIDAVSKLRIPKD